MIQAPSAPTSAAPATPNGITRWWNTWVSPWRLKRMGILGMNCRNHDFIAAYNPRSLFPLVDNKLKTKLLAEEYEVATPKLFFVVYAQHEIATIENKGREGGAGGPVRSEPHHRAPSRAGPRTCVLASTTSDRRLKVRQRTAQSWSKLGPRTSGRAAYWSDSALALRWCAFTNRPESSGESP